MPITPTPATRADAFEKVYLVICILLFVYGILEWRGIVGDGHPWQPVSFIGLSGAMLLQAIAPFVRPRSKTAAWAVLGASLVAIMFSMVASYQLR